MSAGSNGRPTLTDDVLDAAAGLAVAEGYTDPDGRFALWLARRR